MQSSKIFTPKSATPSPKKSEPSDHIIPDEVAEALAQARRDDEFRKRDPEAWAALVKENTERAARGEE